MVEIIFEPHGTTIDNETYRSSGHFDVELSELGKRQSKETSLIPQIKVKLLSGFFFALAKLSLKDLSKK